MISSENWVLHCGSQDRFHVFCHIERNLDNGISFGEWYLRENRDDICHFVYAQALSNIIGE